MVARAWGRKIGKFFVCVFVLFNYKHGLYILLFHIGLELIS